jgi:3-oxoacyl-[acyl-carrier-protein] synthase II
MGCVTPIGFNVASTWEAAAAGRSGVGPLTRFAAEGFSTTIAAEIHGELDAGEVPAKELRRMDRGALMALAAAREALEQSRLEISDANRHRIGVSVGSGIGGLGTLLQNHRAILEKGPGRASPFTIPMSIANMPSGCVSIHHGLRGPNLCHVSACASGSHAIGEGAHVIARGDADVMLVGGSEAPIVDLAVAGFGAMRALSTRNRDPQAASRPFDRDRDGFVIGEGAGVLMLESLEHARRRGAEPLAELLGYGATADATHLAAPEESGDGAVRCMQLALESAGLAPEEVDCLNAHATSTPAGDPIEARALRRVFGAHTDRLPVSATKSTTGHLLGAAGAVEAILGIQSIREGLLPPTINLDDPDPECELDHVAGKARPARVRTVLSNSFGFGGTNACLVLGLLR